MLFFSKLLITLVSRNYKNNNKLYIYRKTVPHKIQPNQIDARFFLGVKMGKGGWGGLGTNIQNKNEKLFMTNIIF